MFSFFWDRASAVLARGLRPLLARGQGTGAAGERAALRFLKRVGYRLLGRNVTTTAGEADLVMEAPDGRTVVIVEVKTRGPEAQDEPDMPEHRVDSRKQRRLAQVGHQVVRRGGLEDRPIRYDVVGVELRQRGEVRVRHHPGAFQAPAGW